MGNYKVKLIKALVAKQKNPVELGEVKRSVTTELRQIILQESERKDTL